MTTFTIFNGSNKLQLNTIDNDVDINPTIKFASTSIIKICTTKNFIFLLNTKHQLYFGNNYSNNNEINLLLLKSNIIDIGCYNDIQIYVTDINGCVYFSNINELDKNEWNEIIISNSKICSHGYKNLNNKIPVANINCNNDGILFTTVNNELYGMGNFGDVLKSDVPCQIECFIGFKILQIATGENFVCVLTSKKLQMNHSSVDDFSEELYNCNNYIKYKSNNNIANNNGMNSYINDNLISYVNTECPMCVKEYQIDDKKVTNNLNKSLTNISIESNHLSTSDIFDIEYELSQTTTTTTTCTLPTTATTISAGISSTAPTTIATKTNQVIIDENGGINTASNFETTNKNIPKDNSITSPRINESVKIVSQHTSNGVSNLLKIEEIDLSTEQNSLNIDSSNVIKNDSMSECGAGDDASFSYYNNSSSLLGIEANLSVDSIIDDIHSEDDIDNKVKKLSHIGSNLIDTSVWCFGSVNNGQLGTGDHIKRTRINSVLGLTGQGVIKISCGKEHALALTLDGRLYLWGNNCNQQISMDVIDDFSSPQQYRNMELTLDACCGANSTYILLNTLQINNLQRDKFQKNTENDEDEFDKNIEFDLSCNSNSSSTLTRSTKSTQSVLLPNDCNSKEIIKNLNEIPIILANNNIFLIQYNNNKNIITNEFIEHYLTSEQKFLQDILNCYLAIIKPFMKKLHYINEKNLYDKLCQQYFILINLTAMNVKSLLDFYNGRCNGIENILMINKSMELISTYRLYTKYCCDLMCLQGFHSINTMLDKTRDGKKIFLNPLRRVWDYIDMLINIINEIQIESVVKEPFEIATNDVHADQEQQQQQLRQCRQHQQKLDLKDYLEAKRTQWEKFRNEKDLTIDHAERTQLFWDTYGKSLITKLQRPERRIILHSKELLLKMSSSGRFSSHWFILFNDSFCHISNNNNITLYPLKILWLQLLSDKPMCHNAIKIITPEDIFIITTINHEDKLRWSDAIECNIKIVLGISSTMKIPQCRNACYTFSNKHTKYANCKYFGKWFMAQMHGIGQLEYVNGKVYIGNMLYGEITGFGRMFTPSVGIYEGDFLNGKYHGYGILEMQNMGTYEGNFKDGQYHGHGILRTKDSTYIGEFLNNIKNGYGVLDDTSGDGKYMGIFVENKKNGCGICIADNGTYFEGIFVNDILSGEGIAIFPNASYYEGELTIYGPNGRGTLCLPMKYATKEHQIQLDEFNIEMKGNVLYGILNGTWADIKINNGNISLNQSFTKFPKSVGLFTIDNSRKWRILFQDWERDVFADNSNNNIITIEKLKYSEIWNRIAIFISNRTLKDKYIYEDFSIQKYENNNNIDYWNRFNIYNADIDNKHKNNNINNPDIDNKHKNNNNKNNNNNNNNSYNININKWKSLDRISVKSTKSMVTIADYSKRRSLDLNNNIRRNNSICNDIMLDETKFINNYTNNNNSINTNKTNSNNEILYDNVKNIKKNSLDFFTFKKETSSTWIFNNISSKNHNNNNNTIFNGTGRNSINLEFIPTFAVDSLTKDDLILLKEYLIQAFRSPYHPLNIIFIKISHCFYSSYGCWKVKPTTIISKQALIEWETITKRIYSYVRKMFPALPVESEYIDGELISYRSLLYPILLSECVYSTLFVLYANKCSKRDELCRQRILICCRKSIEELALFLKIDENLLPLIKSDSYQKAINCLKHIPDKYCPREMLTQIENTFNLIENAKNKILGNQFMINADNMMPLTILLVILANIPHLGAEILLLEDLMGNDLGSVMLGYGGYCFTTLKATYHHILSDKFLQE